MKQLDTFQHHFDKSEKGIGPGMVSLLFSVSPQHETLGEQHSYNVSFGRDSRLSPCLEPLCVRETRTLSAHSSYLQVRLHGGMTRTFAVSLYCICWL